MLSDMNGLSGWVVVCGNKEDSEREYAVTIGDDENDDDQALRGCAEMDEGEESRSCGQVSYRHFVRVRLCPQQQPCCR